MLQETQEVLEAFKNGVGYPLLVILPILILVSPLSTATEFNVFRTQQFEYQGVARGSRTVLVNMEARHISAEVGNRRCMLARLSELSIAQYRAMISKGAGALLVLLPPTLDALTDKEKEKLLELEKELQQDDTQMPVYASFETPELLEIYETIVATAPVAEAHSATEAMLSAVAENTYQFVISGGQASPMPDLPLVNIEGRLGGRGAESTLPTVVFVAHYDADAVFPSLATGADSNASGVVALLELMRILSKLYSSARSHPRYNVVFLLSTAGHYNYHGTKKWIDDHLESSDTSLLSDVLYALCVDSIGQPGALYMHVSKPPKEGSPVDTFYQKAVQISTAKNAANAVQMVHKKINLADESLSWEHERFNIKRMPAFTVSHFASHKTAVRNSLLDTRNSTNIDALAANIEIISNALVWQLFNLSEPDEAFAQSLALDKESMSSWMSYLSQSSRAVSLTNKDSAVLHTLEAAMTKYLKDVRRHVFRADKRDPEFVLYTGSSFTMTAYRVKPAVFDLVLAGVVAVYLLAVYLVLQNFGFIFNKMKVSGATKAKAT